MVTVIYILLLFLSIIGLCDFIHSLRSSLLDVKHRENKVMLCLLKDEYADLQLHFVIEQYNWFGRKYADKIVAISYLADEQLIERCKTIAQKNNIIYIERNELYYKLNSEL